MDSFKCSNCGETWAIKEILPSVEKYGFVSLVGDDDEWIAFNCPENSCFYMVHKKLPPDGGRTFYLEINNVIDPSGEGGIGFSYFSSPPLSKVNYGILNGLDVSDYLQNAKEAIEGTSDKLWAPPAKCFSSCNHNIPFFFSEDYREYIYQSSDIERLLKLEGRDKIRLFPRYVCNLSIFEHLDRFFHAYYITDLSRIKNSINNEEKNNKLLSPVYFYNVLAVPPDSPDPLVHGEEEYNRLKKQSTRHSEIMRKIYPVFQEGRLNNRIALLAKNFAQDYAEKFPHHRLCADTLWEFKENYLVELYQEWTSGNLPKDNNPKRVHPDALVKEQCQFLAVKLYENDKTLSAKEITLCPEMERVAQRPYREPGRENDTKIYPYRRILKWVKEVLPKDTHPKSGRPAGMPRPR